MCYHQNILTHPCWKLVIKHFDGRLQLCFVVFYSLLILDVVRIFCTMAAVSCCCIWTHETCCRFISCILREGLARESKGIPSVKRASFVFNPHPRLCGLVIIARISKVINISHYGNEWAVGGRSSCLDKGIAIFYLISVFVWFNYKSLAIYNLFECQN